MNHKAIFMMLAGFTFSLNLFAKGSRTPAKVSTPSKIQRIDILVEAREARSKFEILRGAKRTELHLVSQYGSRHRLQLLPTDFEQLQTAFAAASPNEACGNQKVTVQMFGANNRKPSATNSFCYQTQSKKTAGKSKLLRTLARLATMSPSTGTKKR